MKATRKRGIEPNIVAQKGLTPELEAAWAVWPDRFRSKVNRTDTCWEWTACKDAAGYGRYGTTRKRGTQAAHRMSIEFTTGNQLCAEDVVDHLCRNTGCVRPDHLDVTTNAINIARGVAANVAGVCRSGRHEWTPENIIIESNGTRRCRPCRDEREKEYRPAKGNAPKDRTHCPQGHPYDDSNTYFKPNGSRECRACHRAQALAHYHRRKQQRAASE